MPVALDYKSDHLVIRLVGASVVSALRRSVVIPFSDIRGAQVESPRWPSLIKEWRIGTHVPGYVAHGTFVTWAGRHRRFVHFDRNSQQVLTIRLAGHPDYEEVSVEVRDAEAAARELEKHASA